MKKNILYVVMSCITISALSQVWFVHAMTGKKRTTQRGYTQSAAKNSYNGVTSTTTNPTTQQTLGYRTSSNEGGVHTVTEQNPYGSRTGSITQGQGGSSQSMGTKGGTGSTTAKIGSGRTTNLTSATGSTHTASSAAGSGKTSSTTTASGATLASTNAAGKGGRSHTVTTASGQTKTFGGQFGGQSGTGGLQGRFAKMLAGGDSSSDTTGSSGASEMGRMTKVGAEKNTEKNSKGAEMQEMMVLGASAKSAQNAQQNAQQNSSQQSNPQDTTSLFNALANQVDDTTQVASNAQAQTSMPKPPAPAPQPTPQPVSAGTAPTTTSTSTAPATSAS